MIPTKDEERVIAALRKITAQWPATAWIFAAPNSICVMRKNKAGQHAMTKHGVVDQSYILAFISFDDIDGGDW